jgi:uncharacterized protein (DUF58 family)
MLATGEQVFSLPPESGQRQLHRALEFLALARDDGTIPLAQALASDEGKISRRATAIVITPTANREIIGPLLALRGRVAQVMLVVLDAESFVSAAQERRPRPSLLALANTPITLSRDALAGTRRRNATGEEYVALAQAAVAAGIDVVPIGAHIPLHQALQGIRMRL